MLCLHWIQQDNWYSWQDTQQVGEPEATMATVATA